MISKEIEVIKKLEEKQATEEEIVLKIINLLKEEDKPEETEINAYNLALEDLGYNSTISYEKPQKLHFNCDEYSSLVSQVTKSKTKTSQLCSYLKIIDEPRLTIAGSSFIKIKWLNELGLLPDLDIFKDLNELSLYDAYLECLNPNSSYQENNELIKMVLTEFYRLIGLDLDNYERKFKMDLEYLLNTIKLNSKDAYLKVNTIKVALSIAPKEYFILNGKKYYQENTHKNLIKYINLIDKNERARIKEKYASDIDNYSDNGYKILFNLL